MKKRLVDLLDAVHESIPRVIVNVMMGFNVSQVRYLIYYQLNLI